jgi:hypothetical protein
MGENGGERMLDIFRWAALFAAIVLIVAVAGAIVSSPSSQPSEQQTAEKNKAENPAEKSNKTLWDRSFPDTISLYTLFLVVFTAVLAAGGLYQLKFLERAEGIAARSAGAAQQAAEAAQSAANTARQTLIASQRAWLSIGPQVVGAIKAGSPVNIELVVQNVGKDPAIGVSQRGTAMPFEMPEQISYAPEIWSADFEQIIRLECDLAVPIKGRATIFPGAKITVPVKWTNQEVVQGLIDRRKILVLYGCIGYITMGENHFTPYCFYLSADIDGNWKIGSAPVGNDAN